MIFWFERCPEGCYLPILSGVRILTFQEAPDQRKFYLKEGFSSILFRLDFFKWVGEHLFQNRPDLERERIAKDSLAISEIPNFYGFWFGISAEF
jgi:hypothetical protein